MKSPSTARVLVAGDEDEEARSLVDLLTNHFDEVGSSTTADAAVAEFEKFAPEVIVMAFKTLEQAEHYYLALHRFSQAIHQHPLRTVLLCRKEDTIAAFDLCKKRYFDDYVLYWPNPQDGLRIPMSVWLAAREAQAQQDGRPTGPELRAHARDLADLDHNLSLGLAEGEKQAEPIKSWAKDLKSKVAPALINTRAISTRLQQHKPSLLAIDDDDAMRTALEEVLDALGYDLIFAASGKEALRTLAHVQPDVILLDIRLSDTDGISLTRQIRLIPRLSKTPIVLISGDSRRDTLINGMAAGATNFIAKPFSGEVLRIKLDKVLRAASS